MGAGGHREREIGKTVWIRLPSFARSTGVLRRPKRTCGLRAACRVLLPAWWHLIIVYIPRRCPVGGVLGWSPKTLAVSGGVSLRCQGRSFWRRVHLLRGSPRRLSYRRAGTLLVGQARALS